MSNKNGTSGEPPKPDSKVETAKRNSRALRGSIGEVFDSDVDQVGHDDGMLLKFHGTYQQDNRDSRKERRAQGLGKEYGFMVRVAIPGGVMTADQYLALDQLATQYSTNGALRITTRQGIQLHGVLKQNVKHAIAGINQSLLTTLGACGDVSRNVMACPAPLDDEAHVALRRVANEIARQLRPATRAYHEIWLDGEKHLTTDVEEPFYGDAYLPRKFKAAVALDSDNCVDIFNYDTGLIAIVSDGALQGFNTVIGGGMGMTHRKPDTFARLAEPFGFVSADDAVTAVRTIAAIFRDSGNRADRKHARLKYLLADWGVDKFRDEFRRRVDIDLAPYRPLSRLPFHDHLGRHAQCQGKWFYGVWIGSGRIVDTPDHRLKSALRTIVEKYRPGVRTTAQQSLLLTDLDATHVDEIEQILFDHGIERVDQLSAARRYAMACPALPTCGLALSESERIIPSVLDELERELDALGLRDQSISIRMTGCPNGCARPYTADIAFVGKGPQNYQVYLGGDLSGERVVDLYAADVAPAEFITVLRPLLQAWANQRQPLENFGDFYQRLIGPRDPRVSVTGDEAPTQNQIPLSVIR